MARDQRAVVLAYTCFAATSGVVGLFVLRSYGTLPATGFLDYWMVLTAVLAGPLSLRVTRGWIGLPGMLGMLRALTGACVGLFVASVIGGTLILPGYGTVYAPLLVLTVILEQPLVGLIWLAGVFTAHRIILLADAARQARLRMQKQQAMLSLSPLSQTYFYRK